MKLRIETEYNFNLRNQTHIIEAYINGSINHLEMGFLMEHAKLNKGLICDKLTYATWLDANDAKDQAYYDEEDGTFITMVNVGTREHMIAKLELDVNTGEATYTINTPMSSVCSGVTKEKAMGCKHMVRLFDGNIILLSPRITNVFRYLEYNDLADNYTTVTQKPEMGRM